MGFDVVEYSKKRKENQASTGKNENTSKKSFDVDYYSKYRKLETESEDLINRVNTWVANNNAFIDNYNKRFDGSYTGYRNDSSDWLANITTQNDNFIKEEDELKATIEYYKEFLDPKFVDELYSAFDGNRDVRSKILESSTKDDEYWKSFGSEADYNYQEGLRTYDYKAGQAELDEMDAILGEALELENKIYMPDREYMGLEAPTQEERDRYNEILDYFKKYGIDPTEVDGGLWDTDYILNYEGIQKYMTEKEPYIEQAKSIQREPEIRETALNAEDLEYYANKVSLDLEDLHLEHAEENELKVYKYYLGKGDTKTAEEYYKIIADYSSQRGGAEKAKWYQENDLEWLLSIATGLDQWWSGVKGAWKSITGDDSYTPPSEVQYARSYVSEDIENPFAQFFFDAGTTISGQLPNILASWVTGGLSGSATAASTAGLTTMGVSAYGNAYTEMINLGYDKNQANMYATLVTASELGLQKLIGGYKYLGGSKLSKGVTEAFASKFDSAIAKFAIRTGGSMFGEFFEEGLQSVLEPAFKSFVTNDNYDVDWSEVWYSGLLGAFSAFGLEGVPTMVVSGVSASVNAIGNAANTSKIGKEFKKSGDINALKSFVLDESNKFSADSVAYKLAGKVNEKTSSYKIGKLLREANAFISEQNKADIKKSLIDKGILPKDADRYVNAISALVAGYEFTTEQISALNAHPAVKQTLVELLDKNSTVNQRMQGYAEAVKMVKEKAETAQNSANKDGSVNASSEAVTGENEAQESVYHYSADGKTVYNNEEVSVKEISSIKDGEVFVRLEDGREVNAKEVSLSSQEEALMYEMVADLGVAPETATAMMDSYNKGKATVSAQDFRADGALAYKYGLIGYAKGLVNLNLDGDQKWDLFKLGRKQAEKNAEALGEASKNGVAKGKPLKFEGKKTKKNGVTYVGINPEAIPHDVQKAGIIGAEILAKSSNLDIVLYASKNVNGEIVVKINGKVVPAPNGMFREGNRIYIDINAGTNKQEGTILYTLAHEVGHFIRQWNPKGFKELGDFLFENYEGEKSVRELINDEIKNLKAQYKAEGKEIPSESQLYDMAYEDVVCNAFSKLLADENAYIKLAELKKQNKTLWAKIGEAIKAFLDRLKKAIGIYSEYGLSERNEAMTKNMAAETYNKLQDMYIKAFVEADNAYANRTLDGSVDLDGNENTHYSTKSMVEGAGLQFIANDNGVYKVLDKDGNPVKSVTAEDIVNSPLGNLVTIARNNGYLGEGKNATLAAKKQYGFLADLINMCIKYEGLAPVWEVAGSMVFSSVKSNADKQYGLTVDFSTVCKKTQAIVDAMSEAMKRLGRGLTRSEVETIYLEVGKAGESTPCPVCYVFSRWMGIGGILDQINNFQDKYSVMSEKKLQDFIAKIDNQVKEKASEKGVAEGKAISMLKAEADRKATSALKAISTNSNTQLQIQELEALMKNQDAKGAKKTAKKIDKLKAKLVDVDVLEAKVKEANDTLEEYEAYQWATRVLMMQSNGVWVKNPAFKPVPPDVLFDLNKGDVFAEKYPLSWAFRTGKGAAAGKAIVPYSDARVGEAIQAVGANDVKKIDIGFELNPFLNGNTKKRNEIVKKAIEKQARQNLVGGMRYQSTSDFRYEYGSDYLITFLEMQAIGAKVQLYTKVIEAVDFLASMGADCNLSVMPLSDGFVILPDGKKKLIYSSVTGINAEAAIKKAHEYNNVQLILVGISDEHIRLALEGLDVTFVIPFHGSGNSVHQIQTLMNLLGENLDVTTAQDYTPVQSDHASPKQTKEQKAMWNLRVKILQGKAFPVSTAEQALMDKNAYLKDLYRRFYLDKTAEEYGIALTTAQAEQIFPYEYWDKSLTYAEADKNGFRFQEYCASMGIIPRFSGLNSKGESVGFGDFTKDKGYWKLLIDRPMYDNTYDADGNWTGYGKYHVQQRINCSNFKVEHIDPEYGSATYGDVMSKANDPKKTNKIVDAALAQFGETKYSTRDSAREFSDTDTKYSIREADPPQKTIKGYKVFFVKDGKLYPPMVANPNGQGTPKGVWLDADDGQLAYNKDGTVKTNSFGRPRVKAGGKGTQGGSGDLAYRPGWHLGDLPMAKQFARADADGNKTLFPEQFVWAECDVAADVEYQEEADAMGYKFSKNGKFNHQQASLDHMPREADGTAGYYRYRTNPDPTTEAWIITGAMKVNRLLTDKEVNSILKEHGREPMPRQGGELNLEKLGLTEDDFAVKYSTRDVAPAFYSQMGKVVEGMKQDKFAANSIIPMLRGRGVKAEEIRWSGIATWLEGKKSVTKQDLLEFIAGSQLQIGEATRSNKEIPYNEYQLARISAYERERDGIVNELKSEWKRVFGNAIPIQNFGAGLEHDVVSKIYDAEKEVKDSKEVGKALASAREDFKKIFDNDDFGYESSKQAYKAAIRDTEWFMSENDLSEEEIAIFERFMRAKTDYHNAEGVALADKRLLIDIARRADGVSRMITNVNMEHYAESNKHMTKWKKYSLEGGENYRELVFTLPNSTYSNQMMQAHWDDDAKGVLVHARIQDFKTASGKKMLFIEEIQSDWHNEGHSKGYSTKEYEDAVESQDKLYDEYKKMDLALTKYVRSNDFMTDPEDTRKKKHEWLRMKADTAQKKYLEAEKVVKSLKEKGAGNTPDAPFKDTYHEYVIKRLLRMAAEQGYDCIGWTPAYMQSKRWSDKFAEAYRIEYDQDIPKFLKKYGRQWGAKVEREQEHIMQPDAYGYEDEAVSVWSMDLTDSMKESVLYEGQTMYSLRGVNKDGIEVYESSEKTKNLSMKERQKAFLDIMQNQYRGRTAKFTRNGHTYYARFEEEDVRKNIYGDKRSDYRGREAKINLGAEGDIFELVENAQYDGSKQEAGKKIASHRDVAYWDYFVKTVQIDNKVFDLLANVRKKNDGGYVYSIQMRINKKVEASPSLNPLLRASNRMLNASTDTTISQNLDSVKGFSENFQKYSVRDPKEQTNRTILAEALESVAKNDIERNKLAQYKEKIALIESEERKLHDINEQLNALYFAKGTKDAEKIKKLKFEQKQTANRINTYDRQLLNLEASKPLKDVLEREKQIAYEKAKQRGKEELAAYREKSAQTTRELMNRYQESRKKAVEGRHKTVIRNQLKRTIADIRRVLNNGTKERNVKIELQDSVSKALALADILLSDEYNNEAIVRLGVESVTEKEANMLAEYNALLDTLEPYRQKLEAMHDEMLELKRNKAPESEIEALKAKMEEIRSNPEYTKASIRKSELNKALADVFVRERNRYDKQKAESIMDALVKAYESLQNSDLDYIKNSYSKELRDRLVSIRDTFKNVSIKDMSIKDLQDLYKAYAMVKHVITEANTLFRNGRKEDLGKRIKAVQSKLRSMNKERKDRPAIFDKIARLLRLFSWNNLRPVDAFERVGVEEFSDLFWDAVSAQDTYARDIVEAGEVISNARAKYKYKKWDLKTAKTFKTANGLEFKLTLGDMMSIYAYTFREQAYEHMTIGGFVFETGKPYKEKKNGVTKVHIKTSETYMVGESVIQEITNSLTAEQKAYVEAIQKYLTELGAKGNEVARILYGIDIFTEEHYFPLQSAEDYRSSVEQALNATQTMVSLKNTGMTKATVPHARNPIVLRSFDDVVLEHIDKMSKYHAYVIPIENMQKVFNNSNQEDVESSPISTQALISSIFGEEATAYFNQYITDLNGGSSISGARNPLASFFGKAKGVAVAANLSVVAQQYFAVIRAMTEIDAKHFIPFLNSKASKSEGSSYEELKKYAPVAVIKEMGGFDVGSNRGAKDYIGMEEAPLDGQKVWKGFQDLTMAGASLMDRFGWVTIWKAVKKEIASTRPDLVVGSEEFLQACGKRFSEVVTRTQVYDSVNTRSGFMRSKHESVKYLTSFMGEPTAAVGMYFTAIINFVRAVKSKDKAAIKKAGAKMARTFATLPVAGMLTAVAKSIVQAMRDDDDEETFVEKWVEKYISNFKDDLNPLTYLPIGRDIMSIIDGWDVERPDMTLIADLITTTQRMFDEDATWEDTLAAVEAFANMLGIPLKNVIRDTRGFINTIQSAIDGEFTTPAGLGLAVREGWKGAEISNREQLYEAILNGDDEQLERVKARYDDADELKSAIRSAFKKHYLAGDIDYDTTIQYLVEYGDMDEDEAYWKLKEWDYEIEHGKDADYSKYDNFYTAVETGKNLKAVIKEYTDNGVDAKTLASQITSHFKPLYKEMTNSQRAGIKGYLLNAYALLGYNRNEKSKDIDNWLKE